MIRRGTIFALLSLSALMSADAMAAMASAELYTSDAFTFGRFEARIQHAPGDGVVSSFFLWKNGSETAGAYWNEIDFEKVGAACAMTTNARYGSPVSNHSRNDTMPGQSCAEYHTYGMDWTPDYIAWTVDGNEFRRETGDTAKAFADNASNGMTIHFNIWPGNSSFGGNISNTTLPVHEYISWVQYSAYTNGSFQTTWRQEFTDATVPTGWAVGNWASPYNLSTHNPQNVGFVNGIAVLSLSADAATGGPGTPPADDGSKAPTGTGGSATPTGGSSGSSGGCSVVAPSHGRALGLVPSLVLATLSLGLALTKRRRSRVTSPAKRRA